MQHAPRPGPATDPRRRVGPRRIRLRRWQHRALAALHQSASPDFLAVATPGAGKTTFALTAAVTHLSRDQGGRVVVVAPTQHLKVQWADAAAQFGLHLEPEWSTRDGRLPSDMHGVVVTYQQVAGSAEELRTLAAGGFTVLDEVHHAGDERAWGDGIRRGFEPAARRLSLSGTPFRSDTVAIPFVRYVDGVAEPDFEYGYGDALADGGVVRPVYFPRIGGHMEWVAPDGTFNSATFDDSLDRQASSQRLRTALSLEGEWLPSVLARAHEQLSQLRASQPSAAGLVIATDQEHARDIAKLLEQRHRVRATVALSDDPGASARITAFADSDDPWIVAVRMVSEGVDIPRLRVGVWATTTTTELFFRQAMGRLVRWTREAGGQKAYLFLPDDPRLRTWAGQVTHQRRHSLIRRKDEWGDRPPPEPTVDLDAVDDEQLSLFAALSSVALDEAAAVESAFDADEWDAFGGDFDDDVGLEIELPPLPGGGGGAGTDGAHGAGSPRERRRRLRDANADAVRALARRSGRSHMEVNAELNRLAGVTRVTEATTDQLERRLAAANKLLERR